MEPANRMMEKVSYWPIYLVGFLFFALWCAIVWSHSFRIRMGEFFSFGMTILFAGVVIVVVIFNAIRSIPVLIAHFFTTAFFPLHDPCVNEDDLQTDKRFSG